MWEEVTGKTVAAGTANAGTVRLRPRLSLGIASLALLAGGADAQAAQFGGGGLGFAGAIGLAVFEHVPGDDDFT